MGCGSVQARRQTVADHKTGSNDSRYRRFKKTTGVDTDVLQSRVLLNFGDETCKKVCCQQLWVLS